MESLEHNFIPFRLHEFDGVIELGILTSEMSRSLSVRVGQYRYQLC